MGVVVSAATEPFGHKVTVALSAFSSDVSYAVLMARSANVIYKKRQVRQIRDQLKEAEARAHVLCRQAGAFTCEAISACGTGDCKFAEERHQITVPASRGRRRRPQLPGQTYGLDAAVAALVQQGGHCT